MLRVLPCTVVLLLITCAAVMAQTPTAAVNGTVHDATGAAVPQAVVMLEQIR